MLSYGLYACPRGDNAQYVNDASLVVSLKDNPNATNAHAKALPPLQGVDIDISPVRVLGQFTQYAADALSVLARHLSQGFDGLPTNRQSVRHVLPASTSIAHGFILSSICYMLAILMTRGEPCEKAFDVPTPPPRRLSVEETWP